MAKTVLQTILACVALLIAVDLLILRPLLGLGYPRHYEQENLLRAPAPYIEFKGKPNVLDHDEWGYRRASAPRSDAINVAFFGGSTGYQGTPPIMSMVEEQKYS